MSQPATGKSIHQIAMPVNSAARSNSKARATESYFNRRFKEMTPRTAHRIAAVTEEKKHAIRALSVVSFCRETRFKPSKTACWRARLSKAKLIRLDLLLSRDRKGAVLPERRTVLRQKLVNEATVTPGLVGGFRSLPAH
jgi:hypothetical protein